MNIAKWEWKKLLRDWKTRILAAAFLLFFATFSLFYQRQTIVFPEEQMEKQYATIHNIFNMLPEKAFAGDTGKKVYDLLADQQRLYGLQLYILKKQEGNTVADWESVLSDYLSNGTRIAHHQAQLLELKEFDNFSFLESFLPSEEQIQRDLLFYDYLADHDLDIEWNSYSASNVLLQEVQVMIGFSLFLFVALLACDRFTKDQVKNWSITQGIPISWRKQWHIRSFHLWIILWGVNLLGLAVSYGISFMQETSGSLWYPVMTYTSSGSRPIAIWQYTLLSLALAMLLSFFLLLLAVGWSWMFRTIYLTILFTLGLYFVPSIWNMVPPLTAWQPSLYLQLEPVLNGTRAAGSQMAGISFEKAFLGILLLIGLVETGSTFLFDRIQTQTLGLQRRTNA